jgi:DNA-directed RNA polymerase specialized sigma24 family protein
VTNLICHVKKGDGAAARELFARYWGRMLGLARARLRGKHLRVANADDVVNSALAGFFLGAERGQYTKLHHRDDLWHLLVKLTIRKAQKLVKEQGRLKRCPRRAGGGISSQGSAGALLLVDVPVEQIADRRPPPDLEVLAKETIDHLLSRLGNAKLRAIAVWKGEGYFNEEIAARLGCCSRTIERKLDLIRTIWKRAGLQAHKPGTVSSVLWS